MSSGWLKNRQMRWDYWLNYIFLHLIGFFTSETLPHRNTGDGPKMKPMPLPLSAIGFEREIYSLKTAFFEMTSDGRISSNFEQHVLTNKCLVQNQSGVKIESDRIFKDFNFTLYQKIQNSLKTQNCSQLRKVRKRRENGGFFLEDLARKFLWPLGDKGP